MLATLSALGIRRSIQTILSVVVDLRFDRRYGTDTHIHGDLASLDVATPSRDHAVAYAPTKSRHFAAVMRACRFPPGSTFVDVGSGKGKVLLLASQYRFAHVIRIELSPRLCRIAENNVRAFESQVPLRAPIQIVEADAGDHELGADANVFFLFNPFDDTILKRFVDNLERSLKASPRGIWILYNFPRRREVFDSHPRCRLIHTVTYANTETLVYVMSAPVTDPNGIDADESEGGT